MRYPPAGTRAHRHGGSRGVSYDSPLNFKDRNISQAAVHKACKNSGPQTLKNLIC